MSEKKYNGWTNQATWKVAVRCNSLADVMFQKEILESEDLANFGFSNYEDSFIHEVIKYFYQDVNWNELENGDWPEVNETDWEDE